MRTNGKTYPIVLKETGNLLWMLGYVLIIPGIVSAFFREWYSVLVFILSAFITMAFGQVLRYLNRNADEPLFNNALIIVSFGWLLATIMGGLPFYLIAQITPPDVLYGFVPEGASYQSSLLYFRNPLHCFFESMSAYTTTCLLYTSDAA